MARLTPSSSSLDRVRSNAGYAQWLASDPRTSSNAHLKETCHDQRHPIPLVSTQRLHPMRDSQRSCQEAARRHRQLMAA